MSRRVAEWCGCCAGILLKKGTSQLFPGMVMSLYTCFGCLTAFEVVTRFCKNSNRCAGASHCVLVCVFLIAGGIETEPLFMCLLGIHVVVFLWCYVVLRVLRVRQLQTVCQVFGLQILSLNL